MRSLVDDYGLPEDVAVRVWNTRILWLVHADADRLQSLHANDLATTYWRVLAQRIAPPSSSTSIASEHEHSPQVPWT